MGSLQWLPARLHASLNITVRFSDYLEEFIAIMSMLDISTMSRYVSPINPAVFPHLTLVLLGIGLFFTAWFFVYEVTSTKFTREITKELVISAVAALFMGFGTLFLLLWVGIYV